MNEFIDGFKNITTDKLFEIGSRKWSIPGALGAFIAESDFATSPYILEALAKALNNRHFGYLTLKDDRSLAYELSGFLNRRFDWSVDAKYIYRIPDILSALKIIIDYFFRALGIEPVLIIPIPSYMPFLYLPHIWGVKTINIPLLQGGDYDLEALENALKKGGNLLVHVNPHNPTGKSYSKGEMSSVAKLIDKYMAKVFSDEVHSPLTYAPHCHIPYVLSSEEGKEHAITAISASKAFNIAGLKCANIIFSNEKDRKIFNSTKAWNSDGASTLGVFANTAAYSSLSEEWLNKQIDYLKRNRDFFADYIKDNLKKAVFKQPDATYLAWIDIREYFPKIDFNKTDFSLNEFFIKYGVAITDGKECGMPGFIRVNFATKQDILYKILERISYALNNEF